MSGHVGRTMTERTGFRVGPIEAVALAKFPNASLMTVTIGDTEIDVRATPKGRRVYVTIKEGHGARVILSAHIDGRWWQPGESS